MKILICLWVMNLISIQLVGQVFEHLFYKGMMEIDIPIHKACQVHSLDDFMGRVNGMHNAFGRSIDTSDTEFKNIQSDPNQWIKFRSMIIRSLMKEELLYDSLSVLRFTEKLVKTEPLDYRITDWHIELPFEFYMCHNTHCGTLFLTTSTVDDKSRWIIEDVSFDAEFDIPIALNIIPEYCVDEFIPPSAHDNGFIAISKLFKTKSTLGYHIPKASKNFDRLAYLIHGGEIELQVPMGVYVFQITSDIKFWTTMNFQIVNYHINE